MYLIKNLNSRKEVNEWRIISQRFCHCKPWWFISLVSSYQLLGNRFRTYGPMAVCACYRTHIRICILLLKASLSCCNCSIDSYRFGVLSLLILSCCGVRWWLPCKWTPQQLTGLCQLGVRFLPFFGLDVSWDIEEVTCSRRNRVHCRLLRHRKPYRICTYFHQHCHNRCFWRSWFQ